MNCKECETAMADLFDRDHGVDLKAGLLEHLQHCSDCAEAYHINLELITALRPKLFPETPFLLKQEIINQLIKDEAEMKNERSIKIRLKPVTKKILSVAAVLLLAMLIIPFTFRSNQFVSSTANAANHFIRLSINASQHIRSMVIRLKIRTLAKDNFELVGTEYGFVDHTITKSFEDPVSWRIDKGGRIVVFDGKNQYLWQPDFDRGIKAGPYAGFISWLRLLLEPGEILSRELKVAAEKNSNVTLTSSGDQTFLAITSKAKDNFMNDFLKNKLIGESNSRREYIFDNSTKLLKGLKIYILENNTETLVLETDHIDYNIPVDPSLFVINLPEGIEWTEATNKFTSEIFKNISSKQAATLFFQGMAENNWKLVEEGCGFFKNHSEKIERIKNDYRGLIVVKIGEPFKLKIYPCEFVPYEIRLKSGRTKKWNLAVRNDNPNKVWQIDGGF